MGLLSHPFDLGLAWIISAGLGHSWLIHYEVAGGLTDWSNMASPGMTQRFSCWSFILEQASLLVLTGLAEFQESEWKCERSVGLELACCDFHQHPVGSGMSRGQSGVQEWGSRFHSLMRLAFK